MFHIITRCTRPDALKKIHASFDDYPVKWSVVFDTNAIISLDADLLYWLNTVGANVLFLKGEEGSYMYPQMNDVILSSTNLYTTLIDDDNIVHPKYFETLYKLISSTHIHDKRVYVYNQLCTDGYVRIAAPENTVVGKTDLAQFAFHPSVLNYVKFKAGYCGDGEFISELYKKTPKDFTFIDEQLCFYNWLENELKPKRNSAPKILYAGSDKPELKSTKFYDYEDDKLNVRYYKDIVEDLTVFNPDCIITKGDETYHYRALSYMNSDIRKRWVDLKSDKNQGDVAYNVAMNYILNIHRPKVSYFTSAYNTKEKIYNAFHCLIAQTNQEWEWVIVNDSPNCKKTKKYLDEMSRYDHRVKVYEFDRKSGGIIGEAKYRAAMLCNGEILAELDHDDWVDTKCTQYLIDAAEKYPQCGFFYTNCVEINEKGESLRYPEGFCFGYGKYEVIDGMNVCIAPPINPKTIRHIVGVPNHIRAWRRDLYHSLGGHNRRLSIADDYELIVRTFLESRFCHINVSAYTQTIYNNSSGENTHNATRADIQRRVRTIMYHYNERIAQRFNELGYEDWAYKQNPTNPIAVESDMGTTTQSIEFIYNPLP